MWQAQHTQRSHLHDDNPHRSTPDGIWHHFQTKGERGSIIAKQSAPPYPVRPYVLVSEYYEIEEMGGFFKYHEGSCSFSERKATADTGSVMATYSMTLVNCLVSKNQ